jgi:hypothetical protein
MSATWPIANGLDIRLPAHWRFDRGHSVAEVDPRTLGITVRIGLWFPDLQPTKPGLPRSAAAGSAENIAAAMHGYAELGVEHLMFQCEPYVPEALERLTAALRLYRSGRQVERAHSALAVDHPPPSRDHIGPDC